MGFQVRKRTKGKGTWTNMSASKRGVHASQSFKSGNVTTNVSSRGVRNTINFGNGVRYVHNTPWKKKKKPASEKRESWFSKWINSIEPTEEKPIEEKPPEVERQLPIHVPPAKPFNAFRAIGKFFMYFLLFVIVIRLIDIVL
jgi:hypothetical protein